MRLLFLLTVPYVRKHKLRSLLTLSGIVIGVAVFVGMHSANQTVAGAFQQTVDRIAGKAQLQVTAGEGGFPEEALEKVQSLREVRAAAPVIEAVLNTGLPGQGNLLVLGVDMTGDRSLRDYDLEGKDDEVVDDPLVFLAQPDSLIVSKQFADRNGLERGRRIRLDTMEGPKDFTIRGIMKTEGMASAYGGNVAVMDIYAAQLVFGRGRMFDRIDIGVAEGVTVDECREKVAAVLGGGYEVDAPATRGRHFDSVARGLSTSINLTSLFALLIGVFIIYNSFSIAITQRRAEIGILRAMGASQRQVLGLFLAESGVAGVAGSCLGVIAGAGFARAVTPRLSYLVTEVYGMQQLVEKPLMTPAMVAASIAIGVLASLAGGLLPARNAARVDPVKALQKGRNQVFGEGENRIRRLVALVMLAAAGAALAFGESNTVFYTGYMTGILSLVLLSPAMALWLARALRPLLKRLLPVEGALAADSLIQAPRRTSATVSALMLSLALAIGFGGIAASIYTSVTRWMDQVLNPDLFVTPTESITARQYRFPASLGPRLAAVPGVAEVQAVRNSRVPVNGTPAMLIAVDLARVARRVRVIAIDGDAAGIVRQASEGKGVYISDSLSRIRGIARGDIVTISTPRGPLRMPVLGRVVDYSDQQGSMFIDHRVYLKHWGDDTVNIYRVYVAKGHDPGAVRREILTRFQDQRKLIVLTNAALRRFILDLTGQWFGMTYLQLAVAVLVAILGIVNTLTVSITDRRRELGVLQAVGALRAQIRRTIWMEAVAIGLIGLILGAVMGSVTLFYNLAMVRRDVAGLVLDYQYPFAMAAWLLPVIVLAAFLASIWPAEAAVRASLVESLEYE